MANTELKDIKIINEKILEAELELMKKETEMMKAQENLFKKQIRAPSEPKDSRQEGSLPSATHSNGIMTKRNWPQLHDGGVIIRAEEPFTEAEIEALKKKLEEGVFRITKLPPKGGFITKHGITSPYYRGSAIPQNRMDELKNPPFNYSQKHIDEIKKQQASVERFKSIFGPKEPAPITIYRYRIQKLMGISYSPYEIQQTKKLSRLELWLIRKILGWRLELQ